MVRIPESLSDVTTEWLTAALRSTGHLGQKILTLRDIQPIGGDSGFASKIGRIRLSVDPPVSSLPESMVVKLATVNSDEARSRILERQYARESSFYSLVWADVGVRTPDCYFVAHETEPSRFVLLLEDLAAARFGDAATGWSRSDARLVVDALAGLHTKWWNHPKLDGWTWLRSFGDVTAQLTSLADRRATFLERYGHVLSPELRRLTMRLGSRHAERLRHLGGPPCTLLHVDTHLDNIAFVDGAAAAPIFFDWQNVAKGPGVVDLASFLSGGSTEERRLYERDLVEQYHSRLAAAGVTGYSLEVLMADYVVALLRWWIGTVNGLGSSDAAAWTGRRKQLAHQSVIRWNAVSADHALVDLVE